MSTNPASSAALRNVHPFLLPQPGPCVGFDVPVVKQEQLVWCWAAAGLCTLDHFDRNPGNLTQCDIVHKAVQGCPVNCGNPSCLSTVDIQILLPLLGLQSQPYTLDPTLPQLLDEGDLVLCEIALGTDSHIVVVHHVCPTGQMILMMDPKQDWDTHQADLKNFHLHREIRSFLLKKADNPPLTQPLPAANHEPAREPAAPTAQGGRFGVLRPARRRVASREEALAKPRPPSAAALLGDRLNAFHEVNLASSSAVADLWFPRFCWSSLEVLSTNPDLNRAEFQGWRQVFKQGTEPVAVVDAMESGTVQVFEKVSTGKAVQRIAGALDQLTARGVDLLKVNLLAVPCLALHMVRFEDEQGQPKLLGAFSLFDEFRGEMDVATFVTRANARAKRERVANHV